MPKGTALRKLAPIDPVLGKVEVAGSICWTPFTSASNAGLRARRQDPRGRRGCADNAAQMERRASRLTGWKSATASDAYTG